MSRLLRAVAGLAVPAVGLSLLTVPAQATESDEPGQPQLVLTPSTASFGTDLETAASWCDFDAVTAPEPYLIEHRSGVLAGDVSSSTLHVVLIGVRDSDLVCVFTTAESAGTVRHLRVRGQSALWRVRPYGETGESITGFEAMGEYPQPDADLEPGFIARSARSVRVPAGEWITWRGEVEINEGYRAERPKWDEAEAAAARDASYAQAQQAYDVAVASDLAVRTEAERRAEDTYQADRAVADAAFAKAAAAVQEVADAEEKAIEAASQREVAALRTVTTGVFGRAIDVEERARLRALAVEQKAVAKAAKARKKALAKAARKKSAAARKKARAAARVRYARLVKKARTARKASIVRAGEVRAAVGRVTDRQFDDGHTAIVGRSIAQGEAVRDRLQVRYNDAAVAHSDAIRPLVAERSHQRRLAEIAFNEATVEPSRVRTALRDEARFLYRARVGGYEDVPGFASSVRVEEKFTF